MSPEEFAALTSEERSRIACELSCLPTLTYAEIGEMMGGRAADTVKNWIRDGRARGLTAKPDLFVGQPPQEPSREEMEWRFVHQDPAAIVRKWGARVADLAEAFDLPLPPALRAAVKLATEGPDDDDSVPTYPVRLAESDVFVDVQTSDEEARVHGLVQSLQAVWEIPNSGWALVKSPIALQLLVDRRLAKPDKLSSRSMSELSLLAGRFGNLQLPFERRRAADTRDYLQHAIDNVQAYLDARGWRETVACPTCGTFVPTYFVKYRQVVQLAAWAREQVSLGREGTDPKAELALAQEILDRTCEHPFLMRELRDLGIAWSQPLLEKFTELQNRFPRLITDAVIAEVLATLFECSPICFDPNLPFSPINRAARLESGRLTTKPVAL